ncbi:MAG: ribosome-associated translation inhibitor RaiA [Cytophagales bacterium]
MEVQVQSIHFDADVKLIEFIEKKVSKLTTFYDRIVGADVYLKVTKKEAKNNKTVEIKLSVPGAVLFATEQEDSFEAATDAAVEALKTQIKKHKEKQVTSHSL